MKTIKGPAVFLAQFAGGGPHLQNLNDMARWAKECGFIGVQLPSWDSRVMDIKKAAESKTYCDELRGTMARHGITDVADVSVAPPSSVALGREKLAEILDTRGDIDCVFCGSDLLALGVLGEARDRGIKVPDELAVCGFGDLEFAAELRPALTSVRVDGKRIGMAAADCLIGISNGTLTAPGDESLSTGGRSPASNA